MADAYKSAYTELACSEGSTVSEDDHSFSNFQLHDDSSFVADCPDCQKKFEEARVKLGTTEGLATFDRQSCAVSKKSDESIIEKLNGFFKEMHRRIFGCSQRKERMADKVSNKT